ncbi:MAG: cytochrome bd-I oxidase subunit CydX [Legionellaceae bacterium]|nr:cytochrome bd-I oxidase subunit CydX [Legionellaceae bacterium]
MWYFSWILGTGLACTLAIVSGVWFELRDQDK